ncbi:ABC transporter permease (plasmid) [Aggregatilineales bacterium SYSU G02658]
MTTITPRKPLEPIAPRRFTLGRRHLYAVLFVLFSLALLSNAGLHAPETTTTFTFGAQDGLAPLVIPTQNFVTAASFISLAVGLFALAAPEHQRRWIGPVVGVGAFTLLLSLLVIGAAGKTTDASTLIRSSFQLATPIMIGALAGIWCERSGVINIAIEGMMLVGACFGFWVLYYLRLAVPADQYGVALTVGVVVAVLGGGLIALLHAWLSIRFAIDQIISGTVINILAAGVTAFIRREYLASTEAGLDRLPTFSIPILKDIPLIGNIFTNGQPIFYLMFVLLIGSHIVLFYTRWGLRTRAIGEKPSAADTLGINVNRMRWTNVFIAGLIAGLGGAWFSLEVTGTFTEGMTRGSGFIALAAMIFGNWTPFGAFGGALLFGFSDALGLRFQILDVPVPYQFLQMVPYIITLVVLAGLVGKAYAPKAIGVPYKKE